MKPKKSPKTPKRRVPLLPWAEGEKLSVDLFNAILKALPDGVLQTGDAQYLQAMADAMAEYFTHGRQYGNQWWKEEERIVAAAFELKRKGVRMFNWAIQDLKDEAKGVDKSYDKPHSSALDAMNGAAFLAAGIRARNAQHNGGIH